MAIPAFLKTIAHAPYYRKNWYDAVREVNASIQFKRHRIKDPIEFLGRLGIDRSTALAGFDRWRPMLDDTIKRVQDAEGSQGGCSIEDGTILFGLCRALRPRVVIETGVAAGISTSFVGAALVENGVGELYSIELPSTEIAGLHDDGAHFDWDRSGVGWAVPLAVHDGLGSRHKLILEDVRSALPRLLSEVKEVDLFFHDDLHTPAQMRWEFNLVWPHIAPGGVLASDDATVGWVDFCEQFGIHEGRFTNLQRLTAVRKPGPSVGHG
jgi:predicted O-methyltransferase YrrM